MLALEYPARRSLRERLAEERRICLRGGVSEVVGSGRESTRCPIGPQALQRKFISAFWIYKFRDGLSLHDASLSFHVALSGSPGGDARLHHITDTFGYHG